MKGSALRDRPSDWFVLLTSSPCGEPIPSPKNQEGEGISMKRYWLPMAAMLAGCSHAELSATTPAPNAVYVAPSSTTEAEAKEAAARVCDYYHSEPVAPAGDADMLRRFECAGRARGGNSFFVELTGL